VLVEAMPVLPAASWPTPPPDVDPADLLWAETVAGGNYSSRVVASGTTIQLTDLAGDACAHVLLLHAHAPWERLNVADTTKVAWQAYLGPGHQLLSDAGRALATIVADSSGRHDAFCGTSTRFVNTERYGDGSPQGPSPAGRELFVLAGAKNGLDPRDLPPSVSFFQGVTVGAEGELAFTGSAGPGAAVRLRAELPLVVLLANVPHPLDPRPTYTCSTLEVLAWRGDPTAPDDPLWTRTPEGERAYLNSAADRRARGGI
jgi:urea carboxylase-associated protein 2